MSNSITGLYDPDKTFDDNFDKGPFPYKKNVAPYKNKSKPAFKFLGKQLNSPFGIAAGPLPTSKHIKYAFDLGYDVVCYKTQRSTTFPSNDFSNVLFLDIDGDLTLEKAKRPQIGRSSTKLPRDKISITNSFGNPSRGPEFWVNDMKKAVSYQRSGQLLISSVVGTIQEGFSPEDYYRDFAKTAEFAVSAGAPAIEINLSCPNVASEGVLCYTHDAVVNISRLVKEAIGNVPLIAKIGYFSGDQQLLLESIAKDSSPFISEISAINTISAPIVNEKGDQALPGPNRLNSGVCGAAIKWAGIDMVRRLQSIKNKFNLNYEIIGIGGVMSVSDFNSYRDSRADVVQTCTGAMWNPDLATEVKLSLKS